MNKERFSHLSADQRRALHIGLLIVEAVVEHKRSKATTSAPSDPHRSGVFAAITAPPAATQAA